MDIDRIGPTNTSSSRGTVSRGANDGSSAGGIDGKNEAGRTVGPAGTAQTTGEIVELISPQSRGQVPFDAARVAEIKAAIAEGRYPIDDRRLAANMIAIERLLD
ncbi:MAG: flagellar biosynthesis anti-sigma factor FlgM [Thioalkalivibrionaceae bacterium]